MWGFALNGSCEGDVLRDCGPPLPKVDGMMKGEKNVAEKVGNM
jgi:hypothetical protein